jgi:hypothetical protein
VARRNETPATSYRAAASLHRASVGVQNPHHAAIRLLRITPDADAQTANVDVLLAGADFPRCANAVAAARDEALVIGSTREANGG